MAIVEAKIGLLRLRGGALSPIRLLWLRSPIGRDRGLKILPVWVRIPLELPHILRGSIAANALVSKTS